MNDAPSRGTGHTVALDEALVARLHALAQGCGVSPATVVLAGVALLIRRYTGEPAPTVSTGDRCLRVDLVEDRLVRDLCRASQLVPCSGPAGFAVRTGPGFADLTVDGVPDEYAADFRADLVPLLGALDPDLSTRDLLPIAAYERRPAPDIARLHGRGSTHANPVRGQTIPEAFAFQLGRHPDRPAVLADDTRATYRELGSAVAATAAALPSGQGPIAVLCRHGVPTVTALLAVLVAGDAYLPLDPVFPARRLALMLTDAAVRAVITDGAHAELAQHLVALAGRPGLPIVHIRPSGSDVDPAALHGAGRPDDPAYVLYTSGSTGTPKGVLQSHRNVLFGVANHVRGFAITPDDRISVLTSFGYDMAVTDTFGALLSGAAAVPVDIHTHGLGHLVDALADRRVTVYHSTPTVYRYLVASLGDGGRLPGVRAILLGGEEVTRHDVALARRHFAPGAVFVNGYGTTEISFATQDHLPPDAPLDHAVVPIGYPLPGIDVALVDGAGRTTCLTGEIVVRTPHVALGYLGQPSLTAARFAEHGGGRAYWTGDIARRLPDGRLVYLGRADRMVKIRGFRVELGEVEAQLAAQPGVARAAVVTRAGAVAGASDKAGTAAGAGVGPAGRGPGEQEIIGYVVLATPGATDPARLRGQLAAVLPDFMVPRTVLIVMDLPIGPTGKLDRAALPDPPPLDPPGSARAASGVDLVDPLEHSIAASWREVLGLAAVDRRANFFDLGGHSLQLALIQRRLEERLDRRVPLPRLIEFPTVASLAEHLAASPTGTTASPTGTTANPTGAAPEPADTGASPTGTDTRLARAGDRMRRRRLARTGDVPRAERNAP